ncbi:hypothetical protein ROLI_045660 (plasmid) [Roseobacter fucihabitans]|uniref:Uncharacterized protein n=1 Tax=Roseobacter fucihabitans TaxID=1537242 RepID=A0ABZ2BZD2_9RHOB|nr:hypothetical protein [Roseobacter litoralis]
MIEQRFVVSDILWARLELYFLGKASDSVSGGWRVP